MVPDIGDAILGGRRPEGMPLQALTESLSVEWTQQQRVACGFRRR
jgi:hypothetical protein